MSQSISVLALSLLASGALTNRRFVTAGGAPAPAAGNAVGVSRTDASDGEAVTVDVLGTAEVVAGGAIANGTAVEVGADGKAVALAAGVVVGRALEAAAADGDVIEVLLVSN